MKKRTFIATIAVALIAGVSIFVACTKENSNKAEKPLQTKNLVIPDIDETSIYIRIPLGTWYQCSPGWGICNPRFWEFRTNAFETNNVIFARFLPDPCNTTKLNMVVYYPYATSDDALIISQGLASNTNIPIIDDIVIDNEYALEQLEFYNPVYVPEGYYPITMSDPDNYAFVVSVPYYNYEQD